jgi:hypothetical protein
MAKTPKRPRDTNQLAKMVADLATGNATESPQSLSAMAELGKQGGLKGGRARAAALTPERRAEIAQKAALKRWKD